MFQTIQSFHCLCLYIEWKTLEEGESMPQCDFMSSEDGSILLVNDKNGYLTLVKSGVGLDFLFNLHTNQT